MFRKSYEDGSEMVSENTRTITRNWILANIPKGSRILAEIYTVTRMPKEMYSYYTVNTNGDLEQYVPETSYKPYYSPGGKIGTITDVSQVFRENIQFMLVGNMYPRYLEDGNFSNIVNNYENLIANGDILFEIHPVPGDNRGPVIQIFQFLEVSNRDG